VHPQPPVLGDGNPGHQAVLEQGAPRVGEESGVQLVAHR
jgi:hypothetical protein